MGGILMEFRGLYETGIKTRNIRSVREAIRLLRSIKIQSRVRTAYRERRCDWNFYRWNPFTIQSWENYARSKIDFQRMKCLRASLFLASGYYQKFTNE